MSIFDFIRERISNIDLDVLSIDGAHPTWDFADLTMLLDSLEREWKEKHPDEDDTISRQAAIDAINSMFAPTPTQMGMKEDCLEIIENLPSAQPSGKDPIEREAVVDILHDAMPGCSESEENLIGEIVCKVDLLPSAQPEKRTEERTETHACDCISRQAAIDAICDNCDHVEAVCPHYPCKQYIAIENLPSAQSEIIRCKDCEWFRKEYGWNCIEYTVCGISPMHHPIMREDDFCSRAERRTDETD